MVVAGCFVEGTGRHQMAPVAGIRGIRVKDIKGNECEFGELVKDRVALVVNTASACGLTPQYRGLEELYSRYKDRGFVVIGFPCNQFAGQVSFLRRLCLGV